MYLDIQCAFWFFWCRVVYGFLTTQLEAVNLLPTVLMLPRAVFQIDHIRLVVTYRSSIITDKLPYVRTLPFESQKQRQPPVPACTRGIGGV
jgi:hypothetical protein